MNNEFQQKMQIWGEIEAYMERRARQKFTHVSSEIASEHILSFDVDVDKVGRSATVTWYCDNQKDSDYSDYELYQEVSFEELAMQEDDYYVYLEELKNIEILRNKILRKEQNELRRKFKESEYWRLKRELGIE